MCSGTQWDLSGRANSYLLFDFFCLHWNWVPFICRGLQQQLRGREMIHSCGHAKSLLYADDLSLITIASLHHHAPLVSCFFKGWTGNLTHPANSLVAREFLRGRYFWVIFFPSLKLWRKRSNDPSSIYTVDCAYCGPNQFPRSPVWFYTSLEKEPCRNLFLAWYIYMLLIVFLHLKN